MRRYLAATCTAVAVTFSAVLLAGGTGAGALAAPAGSRATALIASWGKMLEVPGTAALNVRGQAHVQTISCQAAGS